MRENQSTWPLQEVGERANRLVREFLDLYKPVDVPRGPSAQVQWSRPLKGVFKVNFDASLFENVGCAGIGAAIRDSEGEIIAASSVNSSSIFGGDGRNHGSTLSYSVCARTESL